MFYHVPSIQGYLLEIYRFNCLMAKKQPQRKKATLGHFDHDAFLTNIGKRIKTVRKNKGFNSYELFSYDIEISRAGMAKYESGTFYDIRFRTLLKIIDGLDMTPQEFFSKGFD
jgi:DNA-binding Xre family transcriptional regulator